MHSGVYTITNTITGEQYVGSAKNMANRKSQHYSLLKHDKHSNIPLQDAYREHGKEAFSFDVLEYVPADRLKEVEQTYIDSKNFTANMTDNANGGNGIANHPDREAILARMSAAKIGRKMSPEFSEKMRAAKSGENHHFFGKTLSPEHRAKVGAAHKGKKRPASFSEKMSERMHGEKHPAFIGFYLTPWGRFASTRLAETGCDNAVSRQVIMKGCLDPDRAITRKSYLRSHYLKANFPESIIGQSWRSIGFGFEAAVPPK